MHKWRPVFGFLRERKVGPHAKITEWEPGPFLVAAMRLRGTCEKLLSNKKGKDGLPEVYSICTDLYLMIHKKHGANKTEKRICVRQQPNPSKNSISQKSLMQGTEFNILLPALELACVLHRKHGSRSPILCMTNGLGMLLQVLVSFWKGLDAKHRLYDKVANLVVYATVFTTDPGDRDTLGIDSFHADTRIKILHDRSVFAACFLSMCLAYTHAHDRMNRPWIVPLETLASNFLANTKGKNVNPPKITQYTISASLRLADFGALSNKKGSPIAELVSGGSYLMYRECSEKELNEGLALLFQLSKAMISCGSRMFPRLAEKYRFVSMMLARKLSASSRAAAAPLVLLLLGAAGIHSTYNLGQFCKFFEKSVSPIHSDTLWAMRLMLQNYSSLAVPTDAKVTLLKGCFRMLNEWDKASHSKMATTDLTVHLQIFMLLTCHAVVDGASVSSTDLGILKSFVKKLPPGFVNSVVTGTDDDFTSSFRIQFAHGVDKLLGPGSCVEPQQWHTHASFRVFDVTLKPHNCFSRGLWALVSEQWGTMAVPFSQGLIEEVRLLGAWCLRYKNHPKTYPTTAVVCTAAVRLLKLQMKTERGDKLQPLVRLVEDLEAWEFVPPTELVFLIHYSLVRSTSNPFSDCVILKKTHDAMMNRTLLSFSTCSWWDVMASLTALSTTKYFIQAIPLFSLLCRIFSLMLQEGHSLEYGQFTKIIWSQLAFFARGSHRSESSDIFEQVILPELEDALISLKWPEYPPLLVAIFGLFLSAENDLHFRACTSHLASRLHRQIFDKTFISQYPAGSFQTLVRVAFFKYYLPDSTTQHDPIHALIEAVADTESSYETNSWKDCDPEPHTAEEDVHQLLSLI
eukprot:TRINITY_DN513_c6_g1_i2.p1 TRINITY_DN513_c6_g1~~TRINITY_DN513_c6_g1_i2.p1  ORF type:complete len:857 (+),score=62.13 TRINITY_DN513_c6_g1_i2:127-2697(+)